MNSLPPPRLVSFSRCFRDFLCLPVNSYLPQCLQSDVFSGSSEHRFARGSGHLSQGFTVCESTSSHLFISCNCKRGQINLLPIPVEQFTLSISIGRWFVTMIRGWSDERASSDSHWCLFHLAAWTTVFSGEEKAPVVEYCLVGCSVSL